MMQIKSEQDALDTFGKLMEKRFSEIMSQYSNNIRIGKITNVNVDSRQINVELYGTGEVLSELKYQKGISYGIFVNDTALILSVDPKLRGQNYVVGIY